MNSAAIFGDTVTCYKLHSYLILLRSFPMSKLNYKFNLLINGLFINLLSSMMRPKNVLSWSISYYSHSYLVVNDLNVYTITYSDTTTESASRWKHHIRMRTEHCSVAAHIIDGIHKLLDKLSSLESMNPLWEMNFFISSP